MKFIKCINGWYISTDKIDSFTVAEINLPRKGFVAIAYIGEERFQLKFFHRKQHAQAWLANFVAKFNRGKDYGQTTNN